MENTPLVLTAPRSAAIAERSASRCRARLVIEIATSKTGQRVVCVVIPQLRAILDDAPPHKSPTLAANSRGEPWTDAGFHSAWQRLRRQLESEGKVSPGLTFHGLRHTFATIMREAGFDSRTIADALGQASEQMPRHYSREADLRQQMAEVARRVGNREANRRMNAP